ncbi:DASH complex subunit Dad2-domain-containing protein [Delphinella strobiligena]|nr:DASH complex subunit Dad2-domain-containing protein [Delphinella strobiligena]
MSYRPSGLPSHLRHPSIASSSSSTSQSSALQHRINEKRAELDNLKQLRDLSAGLAGQMEQLEDKLSTLSDGTEAIATVLSNWHTVLRAIHMASAQIPQPKSAGGEPNAAEETKPQLPLPLVRIPLQDVQQIPHDAAQSEDDTPAIE